MLITQIYLNIFWDMTTQLNHILLAYGAKAWQKKDLPKNIIAKKARWARRARRVRRVRRARGLKKAKNSTKEDTTEI